VIPEKTNSNNELVEVKERLERSLCSVLRNDLNAIEKGLKINDNGFERETKAGLINITASDNLNRPVAIKVCAFDAKEEDVIQILALIGALKEEEGCEVRGILVTSGFSEKIKLAVKQTLA